METASPKHRKLLWWVVGAAAVLVVAAVAGPFVYIHFIEGPSPAKLSLPSAPSTTAGTGSTPTSSALWSLSGVWNVGPGSQAGYRVQEFLLGQNATAVGRTTAVWGSVSVDGKAVATGTFSVNMADVVSDQSERNNSFRTRIMDVARYPTATLTLTEPVALGNVPSDGTIHRYAAAGTLDMHGVTKAVSFSVSAERLGAQIAALADIPIHFSDWNIANPSVGGFVNTADKGTLEVLLRLTQGAGNPASVTVPSGGGAPSGGPVTVPSTTVPPLKIPSG
jgi:polyisoprenoid-binding protein YceI